MSWEISITFGVIATAFALLIVATTLDKEHELLKVFLMFIGLFMLLSALALNIPIIEANDGVIDNSTVQNTLINQTSRIYGSFLTVTVISLTYFLAYLGYVFIAGRKERKKQNA